MKGGEKMRVLLKRTEEPSKVIDIENTLEGWKKTIGTENNVDVVAFQHNIRLLCDDMGKINGLPFNFEIIGDFIVGDAFFAAFDGDEDMTDLNDEQIDYIRKEIIGENI